MTNATHTPGPWEVYQSTICTSDGMANEIAKITTYGVWMGDGAPYGPRNPIGDANARLIAAAPDLLAALEALHACHRAFSGNDNWTMLDDEARALAENAIAKSKGQ